MPHKAVKLTVGGRALTFLTNRRDIISALLENAEVTGGTVESMSVHINTRFSLCHRLGFLLTRPKRMAARLYQWRGVDVKAPTFDGSPVCTLQFGSTILELDAEIDAAGSTAPSRAMPGIRNQM